MEQLFSQIQDVFLNLFNSQALMATLGKPEIMLAAFVALNIIIFTETGLLIGFFLPGDSLLVTAGIVAYGSNWPLYWLIPTLCLSAVIGDSVGYLIGWKTGPKLFHKEKSFFFRKDYLLLAQDFYEKHGGKTIILARFMPIIRTFAPVVAGIGKMNYRRFLFFNIFGGIGWVVSMIMLGYCLTPFLDPLLKPIFGEEFKVQKHIEKVIILVVFISIAPGLYAGGKAWLQKRKIAKMPKQSVNPPL
ncbi:MAG: VTT domain-containing protein [Planctomycetes bacterium]|nr:VTT domain-containing protein [Planctomycetota bacterium]